MSFHVSHFLDVKQLFVKLHYTRVVVFFQFVSEVVAGVKIHQVKCENLHSFVPFSSNYRNDVGRNILSQLK